MRNNSKKNKLPVHPLHFFTLQPPPDLMPSPKDTMPPPTDNEQVRKLRQRKPQNLAPGTPDMPQQRRTSAEVRAEKEKKESKKEAAAVKTKAAKARVEEIREALRQEQAEVNTPVEGPVKKVQAGRSQKKNAPQTSGQGVKPKTTPVLVAAASTAEIAIESVTVSISVFRRQRMGYLPEPSSQ